MWCDQCKRDRPEEFFLKVKRGWKVTKCNDCAGANMRRWSHKVITDPNAVTDGDE